MGVAVFQYNFIDKNVQLLTKMEGWIWTCDPSPSQLMWMLLACGLYFLWWCLGRFGQPEDLKKILEKPCPHRGGVRHLQGSGPLQVRGTSVIYCYHKGPGGDTVKMERLWIFSRVYTFPLVGESLPPGWFTMLNDPKDPDLISLNFFLGFLSVLRRMGRIWRSQSLWGSRAFILTLFWIQIPAHISRRIQHCLVHKLACPKLIKVERN